MPIFLTELIKIAAIIIWNILPGFCVVWLLRLFLFFPQYEKRFANGKRVPFTPGFVYKQKNWLIRKLTSLLEDYINDSRNLDEESRISRWEFTVYQKVWNKLEFIAKFRYLPRAWKDKLRNFCAFIVYEISKQFFRSFVPYLMDHFALRRYIELLDKKLDVEIIKQFYLKYIFKYMMLFSLAVATCIGIWNVIIYLIVK